MTSASIFLFSLVTGGSQKRAVAELAAQALAISMADKTLPTVALNWESNPHASPSAHENRLSRQLTRHGLMRLRAYAYDSVIRSLFPIEADFRDRAAARLWGQAARQIEGRL